MLTMPRPQRLPTAESPDLTSFPVPEAAPLPDQTPYPHPTWFQWLGSEVSQPYFQQLQARVQQASKATTVFPPVRDRYNALKLSPENVRVVILGQDPYHGPNQAHGLSFSVRPGVRIPPSLANIYKELEQEGFAPAAGRTGSLEGWASQGVLLLNNVLTVEAGKPGSHRQWGWERFTDAIVALLNTRREGLVFLLWGKDAATKAARVDRSRHLVLTSPHPSPYSANTGFFGNGHFRQANDWLRDHGHPEIDW